MAPLRLLVTRQICQRQAKEFHRDGQILAVGSDQYRIRYKKNVKYSVRRTKYQPVGLPVLPILLWEVRTKRILRAIM
jgi:hypothetical protein